LRSQKERRSLVQHVFESADLRPHVIAEFCKVIATESQTAANQPGPFAGDPHSPAAMDFMTMVEWAFRHMPWLSDMIVHALHCQRRGNIIAYKVSVFRTLGKEN
jgi:hypothetical protein